MSVTGKTFKLSTQKFNEYLGRHTTIADVFVDHNPANLPFKVLTCDESGNILAIEIPGGKVLRADEAELSDYWCVFLENAYDTGNPSCHLTEVKPVTAPSKEESVYYVLTTNKDSKAILGPLTSSDAYEFAERQILNAVPEVVVQVLKIEATASVEVKFK